MNEVKCFWQCQCPYYERTTSYGTEILKCKNTNCPLFSVEAEQAESEDKQMEMYGSILVNGIEVICYPNNDGGFWYFHPVTREIIEVEG